MEKSGGKNFLIPSLFQKNRHSQNWFWLVFLLEWIWNGFEIYVSILVIMKIGPVEELM